MQFFSWTKRKLSVSQRMFSTTFLPPVWLPLSRSSTSISKPIPSCQQHRVRFAFALTRKNIKAFVQWTCDEIRLGRNPADTSFPIDQASDLIRRYKTHEKYQADSKTLAEAAKPEKFKEATKWEDWKQTFLNYIRSIPGRDGIPLKYICREHDEPKRGEHNDFLDDYAAMAPLQGDSYAINTAQVHTFLVNFVAGNDTAEAKIQGLQRTNNGREA